MVDPRSPFLSALRGNSAVAVVFVDGPQGSPAHFLLPELVFSLTEVVQGLNILARLANSWAVTREPRVQHQIWRYTLLLPVVVPIHVDPAAIKRGSQLDRPEGQERDNEKLNEDISAAEELWLTAALKKMNRLPGEGAPAAQRIGDGIVWLNRALVAETWRNPPITGPATHGFTIFVTKYNTGWYAYQSGSAPDDRRVILQHENLVGQFGDHDLDRVVAHEVGHVFDAPDEYQDSDCTTTELKGVFSSPNKNCEVDNPSSEECLMKENTEVVCEHTAGHWGLVDFDQDGIVDTAGPLVSGLRPKSAIPGAHIVLIGSGFLGAQSVRFGGVETTFTVASDTRIVAVVPLGAGAVDVTVVGPLGTSPVGGKLKTQFTYLLIPDPVAPTLISITPSTASPGQRVKFEGILGPPETDLAVRFGDWAPRPAENKSEFSCEVEVPFGVGTVEVSVGAQPLGADVVWAPVNPLVSFTFEEPGT